MNEKVSRLPEKDKASWPDGPWRAEPDRVEWRDRATALPCLALRHPTMGHWCGYVGVGPAHPWHGMFWDEPKAAICSSACHDAHGLYLAHHHDCTVAANLIVHGGVNFSSACEPADRGEHRVCHTPAPGEADEVWWFGFDCAHAGDRTPAVSAITRLRYGIYRTLDYVREECARLAAQLQEVAG